MTTADARSVAAKVVQDVGAYCLDAFESGLPKAIVQKAARDFVTEVDRGAELFARGRLADLTPDIPVVGEEFGGSTCAEYWILDPLDGTTNFLSGLPIWAVSVALIQDGVPVSGAIAVPPMGFALAADLNAVESFGRLRPRHDDFGHLVAVGRNPHWPVERRQSYENGLEERGYTVVSIGSCAASLALVAMGRLAGYVEIQTRLWDCAAGIAICRSLGISARTTDPDEAMRVDVLAGAATAHIPGIGATRSVAL